jgi:hypothetical protein
MGQEDGNDKGPALGFPIAGADYGVSGTR